MTLDGGAGSVHTCVAGGKIGISACRIDQVELAIGFVVRVLRDGEQVHGRVLPFRK
jgi:hypothetical protein